MRACAGEVGELRAELGSSSLEKMKDAVKKVIANVTVGKDMSSLFPDVVNCMRTDNLEIKKLVYLYLINYAKSNPEMALMAVNAFVKDTSNTNPMIRALAIRTMGAIRVERITEYLCLPLKRALVDDDPYVRKTAAICVAKLFDISPMLAKEQGFLDMLVELLSDSVPQVVSNAVAALSEISDSVGRPVYELTQARLQKLLAALNECSEWGQSFILDALATYNPADSRESETIAERVSPLLAHRNPGVVLGAVKLILRMMDRVSRDKVAALGAKLGPPLVTLAQAPQPEVQYVVLRNIALIVQKRPAILAGRHRVFVCKYADPIYVKMEKLEILVRLASESNIDDILSELKEYAQEVDVEYVRRAVRTIGRCAIKLDAAAERCIKVLLQLIQTKVSYVVQEAVVVVRDIFRRYPNRYESVIGVLCEALDSLDEPEAKAALVWIVGEYADRIENADELLESFLDNFNDETSGVQLALLTAIVKLYLKRPSDTQEIVKRVLDLATEKSDNPDLRDRGYIYWRLLSRDPDAARAVILAEKPVIEDDTNAVPSDKLDDFISQLATLAAVYHKPADAFVRRARKAGEFGKDDDDDDEDEDDESRGPAGEADLLGIPGAAPPTAAAAGSGSRGGGAPSSPPASASAADDEDDLFGGGKPKGGAAGGGGGGGGAAASGGRKPTDLPVVGEKDGLKVRAEFARAGPSSDEIQLHLAVENQQAGAGPVTQSPLRVNVNTFGLSPVAKGLDFPAGGARPGQAVFVAPLDFVVDDSKVKASDEASTLIDVAVRDNATGNAVIARVPFPYEVSFVRAGRMERAEWLSMWKSVSADDEAKGGAKDVAVSDPDGVRAYLEANARLFFIADRKADGETKLYFSARGLGSSGGDIGAGKAHVLVELRFRDGFNAIAATVRSDQKAVAKPALDGVVRILKAIPAAGSAAITSGVEEADLFG